MDSRREQEHLNDMLMMALQFKKEMRERERTDQMMHVFLLIVQIIILLVWWLGIV